MVLETTSPRAARGRACGGAVERTQLQLKSTVWVKWPDWMMPEKRNQKSGPTASEKSIPNGRDVHVQKNKRAFPNSREEARAKE